MRCLSIFDLVLKKVVYVSIVLLSFILLCPSSQADIGESVSSLTQKYGQPTAGKPTATGMISAWKSDSGEVVMAEFGPDGLARNVAYRTTTGISDSDVEEFLSRNSSVAGRFYRVDKAKLDRLLMDFSSAGNGGSSVSPEVAAFAKQLNPAALGQLRQSLAGIADLRATEDGKFISLVDPRGSVVVVRIDGPRLPLLD
jgi:hypothetical protein